MWNKNIIFIKNRSVEIQVNNIFIFKRMREKENLRNTISDEEQRDFIKFCYLLDYSASVATSELKKALGNKALSKKTVSKWLIKFHNGEILAKDGRGGGHL